MRKKGKKQDTSKGISRPVMILAVALIALSATKIVQATLLDGPSIIPAPPVIADNTPGATNEQQQAFDERQSVTLAEDVICSNAIVPAGEVVNSHMIFYNTRFSSPTVDANRTWTFEDEVICVMAERNGLLQALTDSILGAPGTQYPGPFASRGLESDGSDSYSINGNQLTVTMTAEEPGDWIRVLTKVSVPPDTTAPVVYCEAGANPSGKTQENKGQENDNGKDVFVSLIGADETDGAVDIYLTDTASEVEFGPFEAGTLVQLIKAKGATPSQSAGKGEVDYTIRVNGSTMISATDVAGNEGSAKCSS